MCFLLDQNRVPCTALQWNLISAQIWISVITYHRNVSCKRVETKNAGLWFGINNAQDRRASGLSSFAYTVYFMPTKINRSSRELWTLSWNELDSIYADDNIIPIVNANALSAGIQYRYLVVYDQRRQKPKVKYRYVRQMNCCTIPKTTRCRWKVYPSRSEIQFNWTRRALDQQSLNILRPTVYCSLFHCSLFTAHGY